MKLKKMNSDILWSDSSPSLVPPDHSLTASDLLLGAYDPAKLHPLTKLGDKLDYLLLDDDKTNELPGTRTGMKMHSSGCMGVQEA